MNTNFKKKEKYYALSGVNGYGVYNDYSRVKDAVRFLANPYCERYDSFDKAKEAATTRFYDIQENFLWEVEIDEIERMNWLYYRKKNQRL